jgi:hypothetical protein
LAPAGDVAGALHAPTEVDVFHQQHAGIATKVAENDLCQAEA